MSEQDTRIARNSLLNLAGQGLPLLVGLLAVPYVVSRMDAEHFGLLSLVWALLGTFALFNFGLSKATTKSVAEFQTRGTEVKGFSALVWTSFWLQLAVGCGLALPAALSLRYILPLLKSAPAMAGETRDVFLILVLSIPVIVGVLAWRGVLEGAGRFGLVNLVRGPQVAMIFLVPALALSLGLGLRAIALLLIAVWMVSGAVYALACLWIFPSLRRIEFALAVVPRLAIFGGWVSVPSLIGPAFIYCDRFLIGSLVSVSAVGFYAVPYEMTTRLTIVPSSIVAALFPAFSALRSTGDQRGAAALFSKSMRLLLLICLPLVLLLACAAHPLLRLWVGEQFASRGTTVLQLLALGILFNSVAYIPASFLQSIGRPDLPAKFNLAEAPFYFAAAWLLTKHYGVDGAALANLIRVVADALLLLLAARRFLSQGQSRLQPGCAAAVPASLLGAVNSEP